MARSKRTKKKATATPSPGDGLVALTRQLWQAAVELRGSIEPADYKRYVLPIIFLRFLSLRYERRRMELERLIADPKSEYHRDKKALDDPDEYRASGAFIVPEAARWNSIVKVAQRDDVKTRLDGILETLEKKYPQQLRGLLPPVYAGSNMDRGNLAALINLFSKDVFAQDHGGEDLLGRVYEYFIGEFASSEGKRGGEYFTPSSIVRTLVAMLEPERGVVFDPCCGSGGMFVQSDIFRRHDGQLSFKGQESKEFTLRLCRMNLFIHGLDGDIQPGNAYFDDRHPKLRADYVLANPPFNDGSKGDNGWGADKIAADDPRLVVGGKRMPLSPRNANTMWMLHFLAHLKDTGTAGFVMATGELTSAETARLEVRKSLVEAGHVDAIVQLSGQLFANTQIPCALLFLAKNRDGRGGFRSRKDEILFLDARKLGALIPGSRKQKQLTEEDVERIAAAYREYRRKCRPAEQPGFTNVATLDAVRANGYVLTPGRYVGAAEADQDDESLEEKLPRLVATFREQVERGHALDLEVQHSLGRLVHGG